MEVGNIFVTLGLKMDEFDKGLSTAEKAMVKVGDKFQSIGKSLTIAGGAITAAMGAIILKTTALGDNFDDLSQRTGISTEVLSSFSLAVNKTDMGIAGFATALKFLANNMADASTKGGEAKAKFDTLGVSFKNLDGTLRPLDQVMLDVADRFAAMPDGAQKSALAVDLFGRAGTGMIHMLNLGRDGLQAEIDKAKEFGIVFTTEAAGASDKFQESLVDLKGALQGVGMTITAAVLPMVQGVITGITGVISKVTAWMQAHPLLTKVISGTVLVIGGLLTAIGTLSFTIGTVLKQLPTFIKGLNVIKAIALNPIVITIAIAIPVLAKALSDFKKEFDNMRDAMKEAGKSGFIGFLEGVNSGWRKVALGIKDSNIVMSEANNKIVSVKGAMILLGDAFRAIKGAIDAGATSVTKIANVFKDFGLKTRTELTEELANAENALKLLKASAEATPGAIKALEDKIKTLKEGITGVTVETRSLAEQLGITFRSDIEAQIKKLNEALLTYRGKMTAEEIARIYGEINALTESLTRLKGPIFDVDKAITNMLDGLDDTAEEVASAISALFADGFEEIKREGEKVIENDLPAHLRNLPVVAKESTDGIANAFKECSDDMAKAFGEAFASIIRDGLNFANFFKSLMQGIVNAVATLIGKQLTTTIGNFFTKLGAQAGGVFSGFSASASAAAFGIAAGFAAMWVGIGIGMIESKRQWDEYWDKVIEDARRAGHTIVEVVSAAMLKASSSGVGLTGTIDPNKVIGGSALQRAISTVAYALSAFQKKTAGSSEALEAAWENLIATVQGLGAEGSAAFIALIKQMRAAGIESAALTKYVQAQLSRIPDALSALVDTKQSGESIKRVGIIALTSFNAMIAAGMSWYDALQAMKEPLAALKEKYAALGVTADASLKQLFRVVGITEKHKALFDAISANKTILEALGNSGFLTADALSALAKNARVYYYQLKKAGMTSNEALRAMSPTLQQIYDYAKAYGITLDDNTQKLIDQAKKAGYVKDKVDVGEEAKKSNELLGKICDTLKDIADALKKVVDGVTDIGDAGKDSATDFKTSWRDAIKDIKERLKGVEMPGPGDKENGRGKVATFQAGGIAWRPQLARIAEHGPEIIMPLRDYRADAIPSTGGRNRAVNLTFNVNAIDRAGIETFLRRDARPILQRMLDHNDFNVPAGAVGGP